jgi:regulator of sigma E protease
MQVLNMIFYTAITLGVLIFIHEFGHFIAAKLTGMRVERFSIGFPPRAFGKIIGDTDYCVSWIPIGGYVKIAGMIDESFDTDFLKGEPQPWEFRARPMWARMVVISAGVIMNILLAIGIFWGVNYTNGRLISETTEIGYVIEGSAAEKAGLCAGDKIFSVNGKAVTHWDEVLASIYVENLGNDITVIVERGGKQKQILVSRKNIPDPREQFFGIIQAHTVVIIQKVEPGKPADKLGVKAGDTIVALNDTPIVNERQVLKIVHETAGKVLRVTWKHGEQLLSGTTTTENGIIGVWPVSTYNGPTKQIKYSLLEAFPKGLKDIVQAGELFFKSIAQVVTGKISFKESFGGPIKIAQLATQSAEYGVISYLTFIALLSMSLAILNILPIPALDGGHLMMLLYEKIFRREIPHKVKLFIQQAGFILLLAFMAFVIYNDITSF